MKLIRESVELFTPQGVLNPTYQEHFAKYIESCGRECYKSTHKVKSGSAYKFVKNLINSGHYSVLEHVSVSAKLITNRGVTHELVRHRLGAVSQESTRYCNYSSDRFGNELTFIIPTWVTDEEVNRYSLTEEVNLDHVNDPVYIWKSQMLSAERMYIYLLKLGWTPEKAREILPNSLATTIVVTYNIRQWRHIIHQRLDRKCHPQMRSIMSQVASQFLTSLPLFFSDIVTEDQMNLLNNEE